MALLWNPNWRPPPSWILDIWHFSHTIQSVVLFCTYIQNLSQIHKSSAKLWLFLKSILFLRKWCFWPRYRVYFCTSVPNLMIILPSTAQKLHDDEIQNGGRRHLKFWLDGIFGQVVRFMAIYYTNPKKIEPNPSILGKVMAFFCEIQNGGRPPFWNCNDVIYDYPHWEFGNVMSVLEFHLNTLFSFEDIEIFIFLRLGWDRLTTPTFKVFLGIWPLKCERPSCGPPKTHPCLISRNVSHCALKSAHGHFSKRVREK